MNAEKRPEQVLGNRIRRARKESSKTLKQVADVVGVSESFLSQIERGVASPSVQTLRLISSAVGRPVTWLLATDAGEGRLVRKADRRRLVDPEHHWVDEFLTPVTATHLQLNCTVVEPGHHEAAYSHDSDEECVVLLKGTLRVWVDSNAFDLEPGDSLLLDPRLPHSFANLGTESAEVLWVMTPPSY
ncbi:MAG: helix-turn-helix domain-containing protein [Solirubrobacterales bacterium]